MSRKFESIRELAEALPNQPDLVDKLKHDPAETLKQIAKPPAYQHDRVFYRLAVAGLLVVVLGALVIAGLAGKDDPNQLVTALGTGALGAVAGLLAPLRG